MWDTDSCTSTSATTPRVTVVERTNIRHADPDQLGAPFEVIVADVSFISLLTIAPVLASLGNTGSQYILLVKPQFEAGPGSVDRRGVLRDRTLWNRTVAATVTGLSARGLGAIGLVRSPVAGAKREPRSPGIVPPGAPGDRSGANSGGSPMRIALVPHIGQGHTVAWTRDMVAALQDRGVEVVSAPDAADLIGVASTPFGEEAALDLVVAIGGDGTVLKAVRLGRGSGAPIYGINDGRLGYLADAVPDDVPNLLDRMASGEWLTSERMLLAASINGAPPTIGLNDVVVEKIENQRTVRLGISIDGEPFINYPADGVVVATATGSTAYNLSAGGPLIDPALDMLVMTPVAPHFLFSRAMVFPPDRRLRFDVMDDRSAGVGVGRPGDRHHASGRLDRGRGRRSRNVRRLRRAFLPRIREAEVLAGLIRARRTVGQQPRDHRYGPGGVHARDGGGERRDRSGQDPHAGRPPDAHRSPRPFRTHRAAR